MNIILHIGVKNYLKLHLNYHIHENQDGTTDEFETLHELFDKSAYELLLTQENAIVKSINNFLLE